MEFLAGGGSSTDKQSLETIYLTYLTRIDMINQSAACRLSFCPSAPPLRVFNPMNATTEKDRSLEMPQPLEATPEFLAELAEQSARLETASPEEIIAWGRERYAPHLAMATAFGPEGCLILSMLAKVAPDTYVFNLDTGYQFQQTLDLRDRIAEKYGIEVEMLQPELSVPEYEAKHGGPLYKTNPTQCCFDRKIKVLQRAAEGQHAWMSGIRRDQSSARAQAPIAGWDKKFNLVKISPWLIGRRKKFGRGSLPRVFPTTRYTIRAIPVSAAGPALAQW